MNENRILFGSEKALPKIKHLKAGSLTLMYEHGFLRYIHAGDVEVVRMINHAVRDQHWNTFPFTIVEEDIEVRSDSFAIHYIAKVDSAPVQMEWDCRITGNADSTIDFEIKGEIQNEFLRNRIGLTILHPTYNNPGRKVTIVHPDGTSEDSSFPTLISPHQPFFNIRKMHWSPDQRVTAELVFEGDIFETEDQRNWTDESFKTYSTPLEKPFPVAVKNGDVVHQKVTLSISGTPSDEAPEQKFVSLKPTGTTSRLPRIGVSKSTTGITMTPEDIGKIRALNLTHYRCETRLEDPSWEKKYAEACDEAAQLSLPLELALFFRDTNVNTDTLTRLLEHAKAKIGDIALLSESGKVTSEYVLATAGPFLRSLAKADKVGAGTNGFFADLNRNRITSPSADFLCWSISPQVHAVDHRTLIENLQALTYVIETARHFAQEKLLHISPVTLKMRRAKDSLAGDAIPVDADPRQASLFGAAWTLGCIKHVSEAGLDSITLFEAAGCKGILRGSDAGPFWDGFGITSGDVYPVWHALKWIGECNDGEILSTKSSRPLKAEGLMIKKRDGKRRLLLMNYSDETQTILTEKNFKTLRILDEQNYHESCRETTFFDNHFHSIADQSEVELPRFAIARLDE